MRIRSDLSSILMAGLLPLPALAQEEGAVELSTITVTSTSETATGPVDGIVATQSATGTKTDTPILETPRSISVVTAEEIAQRGGAQTISQTLGYTPGVFSVPNSSNRGGFNDRIRGFSDYGSVFVDGLPDPVGIDRAEPQLDPYAAERVEVLKGPASVLYGQISPGGLVNIVSKRPTFGNERSVQAQVGSFELYQGAFDLNGVLADNAMGWRLVGLGQLADSQVEFAEDNRLYVAPSLAWRNETTSLTILTHYRRTTGSEADQALPPEFIDRLPTNLNPGDPDFDKDEATQWALGYEFVHELAPNLVLEQNLRYFHLDVDYRQLYLAYPLNDEGLYARSAYLLDETIRQLAVDTRLRWNVSTGPVAHTLLAGFDYRDQRNENSSLYAYGAGPPIDLFNPVYGQPVGPFGPWPEATEDLEQIGVYLQDQIAYGSWRATLGGRWDHAEARYDNADDEFDTETDDRHFSGNAGLLYLFDNGFAPYASWAQSFQPQSGQTWDNKPFKPTEGEQFEIGVKYQPPGLDALVTLAAFDLTQKNVVTADLEHRDEQVQTGEVRSRGIELEGRAMLGPVEAILAYAWLDAEITRANDGTEGNVWPDAPRNTASLWLDYGIEGGPLDGVSLGGGVRAWSGSYGDDTTNSDTAWNSGGAVFDMAIDYDFGALRPQWQGIALNLAVTNIGNRRIPYCSPWGCDFGQERVASATLSYAW